MILLVNACSFHCNSVWYTLDNVHQTLQLQTGTCVLYQVISMSEYIISLLENTSQKGYMFKESNIGAVPQTVAHPKR